MENKHVGLLIVGIGIVVGILVLIFNLSLRNIAGMTCSHGSECGMYGTMNSQLWISLTITIIIFILGFMIMFMKPNEKIIVKTKKVRERKKRINMNGLNEKDKKAVSLLVESGGMFQADLKEKLEIGKVGMTRLLDKLEAKQIIERKRRGKNNFVVLKR